MKLRDLKSGLAVEAPRTLEDDIAPADLICRARSALTVALATPLRRRDRSAPVLRDFLDADMPDWLALAAHKEMGRQAEIAHLSGDTLGHIERWWWFVRSAAAQSGATNGIRFPP